ncbi:endocuticle structural glycoprotein SgAbd-2-like [Photinus pyralis]|uniref:endocuticle structural glycoprotein SgAbd-2-like n=1 Tax=Photinus pyralis TaxID=7054 RepID=UPI00126718C8|nr:endocuticle structural glycoprotein SgAbd-2-like [Photinus pyralis]
MMLLLLYFATAAFAASLENTYLPPGNAKDAGGHNEFLHAPIKQASFTSGTVTNSLNKAVEPIRREPPANILKFENVNDGFGSYSYGYDTDNHISVYETGQLKNLGSENEVNAVHGSFSYRGIDGIEYTVEYTADENGFQARGAHLPTPPPIPDVILKSLEINAASASDNDDGQYKATAYIPQHASPKKVDVEQQKQGYHY